MKRKKGSLMLLLLLPASLGFAGGGKEVKQEIRKEEKILRICETVVDFALPGQSWGGDVAVNAAIYDYLVEVGENGDLIPELAKSWSSTDGKVWTVTLQKGVTFHDGSAFNADDLIFCVERTQDPKLNHVDKKNFSVVERIERVDDYTVKFHLNAIRPTFMYYFTGWNMIMLSSDYDYAGMGVTKPMGTGPFIVKEIIIGEGAVLRKNPEYWDVGLPKLDEVRYYFISDMETRMNMLEQGKADIVRDMAVTNIPRIEANPDLKYSVPYTYFRIVSMNVSTDPFKDKRVVEALKLAMDPSVIAQACQGKLGKDIFFNENFVAASQKEYVSIPPRERNVDKAKQLLAEAGYPNGLAIDLFFESDIDFSTPIALAMQGLAKPAGFTINLKGHPRDIFLSQYWAQVNFSITAWTPRIEPSLLFELAAYTGAPWSEMKMAEPEADAILDKLVAETDEAKRLKLWAEYQKWFAAKGAMFNLQVPFIVAQRSRVLNYHEPLTRNPRIEEIDLKVGE